MSRNSQNVMNCIKNRKANLIKVFNSQCCLCGFNAVQEALEFHHVDPSTKSFGISGRNSITKGLAIQLEELKKCILVCSNCHKGIHYGYYQIPENWQSLYQQDVAEQLLFDLKQLRTPKIHQCQTCGKIISAQATYCPECATIAARTVDRPTRDELKNLIRTIPFTTIAAQYHVSDNAIRKWCDYYNLPRKKSEIKQYTDQEWLKI